MDKWKRTLFLLILVLMAVSAVQSGSYAQADESDPEPVKLTIHYFLDGEEEPFLTSVYQGRPGSSCNILHPVVEGYEPESPRLIMTLTEDTEMIVSYRLLSFVLQIHYRFLNGKQAAPDYRAEAEFGSEYQVQSPHLYGYITVDPEISGTMPGRDVERTTFFVPG